jgi:hypothetical protein
MIMKAEIGGRHRLPLLAPLRGAIVIPLVSRWYRPLSRTQPPANGFEPSGFASDRCSKRSAPTVPSKTEIRNRNLDPQIRDWQLEIWTLEPGPLDLKPET